jgi:hypothetical protein
VREDGDGDSLQSAYQMACHGVDFCHGRDSIRLRGTSQAWRWSVRDLWKDGAQEIGDMAQLLCAISIHRGRGLELNAD